MHQKNNKSKMMLMMLVMLILVIGSAVYVLQGVNMHKQVDVEEARFHALQSEYFTNSKSIRDSAASGSELTEQLVGIQNFPSELLRLKLVGVGRILTGIWLSLIAILFALTMMPVRLAKIIMMHKNGGSA